MHIRVVNKPIFHNAFKGVYMLLLFTNEMSTFKCTTTGVLVKNCCKMVQNGQKKPVFC